MDLLELDPDHDAAALGERHAVLPASQGARGVQGPGRQPQTLQAQARPSRSR